MGFKAYTYFILSIVVGVFLSIGIAAYVVDPIGIWGTKDIQGFNQAKVKQGSFLDIYKQYEYKRLQPDVIWIGTSRVYVGFAPDKSQNEYNMGLSSISLADVRKYLQFMYRNRRPKKVYIGLDLFQFGPEFRHMESAKTLDRRLEALSCGGPIQLAMAIKDSFGTRNTIWPTVKDSQANNIQYFRRGWDIKRGNAAKTHAGEYYSALSSYRKTYDDFYYDEDAMNCFRDIVQDAKDNNVELVVFFNPISVDLQALQDVYGLSEEFYAIKRLVAEIHPVYDFCWVNKYTVDRVEWFYDASHFRNKYGQMCRDAMNGTENGTGIYLTTDNVDELLEKEKQAFSEWKKQNHDYYDALEKYSKDLNADSRILAEYIGII